MTPCTQNRCATKLRHSPFVCWTPTLGKPSNIGGCPLLFMSAASAETRLHILNLSRRWSLLHRFSHRRERPASRRYAVGGYVMTHHALPTQMPYTPRKVAGQGARTKRHKHLFAPCDGRNKERSHKHNPRHIAPQSPHQSARESVGSVGWVSPREPPTKSNTQQENTLNPAVGSSP